MQKPEVGYNWKGVSGAVVPFRNDLMTSSKSSISNHSSSRFGSGRGASCDAHFASGCDAHSNSRRGCNSFALKIIAIVGMTANHAAHLFYNNLPFEFVCTLYALGGLTFPIMAFLLTEGYRHTSNFNKYALRLLVFAAITQLPYQLFLADQGNVLFTLLLGLMLIRIYDTFDSRIVFLGVFVVSLVVGFVLDWGSVGTVMIFLFHVLKGKVRRVIIPMAITILSLGLPQLSLLLPTFEMQYLPPVLYVFIGCTLTIPLLISYNGKRGAPLKYFFYLYYPAHILVLGIIKGLIFSEWPL